MSQKIYFWFSSVTCSEALKKAICYWFHAIKLVINSHQEKNINFLDLSLSSFKHVYCKYLREILKVVNTTTLRISQNGLHEVYRLLDGWSDIINTSYLTDSYISFTLKLESRQIFFNSLIRSSTHGKKNISDFPPCGKMVVFVTEFVIFFKTSK